MILPMLIMNKRFLILNSLDWMIPQVHQVCHCLFMYHCRIIFGRSLFVYMLWTNNSSFRSCFKSAVSNFCMNCWFINVKVQSQHFLSVLHLSSTVCLLFFYFIGTTSPTLPRPPQRLTNQAAGGVGSLPMPISSSPINNNNHLEQKISSSHSSRPPKLPPKGIVPPPLPPTSSAGSLSSCSSTNGGPTSRAALKRKAPQRNPSRLYRIVKPLTEMATTPSPATNRCIGPEFFVMQDNHPKVCVCILICTFYWTWSR